MASEYSAGTARNRVSDSEQRREKSCVPLFLVHEASVNNRNERKAGRMTLCPTRRACGQVESSETGLEYEDKKDD